MADQSDVETALVGLVSAALYPAGLSGTPPLSVLGVAARVYRGWPNGDALDSDLRAGYFNVSVFGRPGMERDTTRFAPADVVVTPPVVTVTAVVLGRSITFGGVVSIPQNIAVSAGGQVFAYAVRPGDTLTSIAAALAGLINAATPASSAGAVLTLSQAADIGVAIGGVAGTLRELKRQQKQFQIVFWCPNTLLRDQACALVDAALAAVDFISLPDGSLGRMLYQSTTQDDAPQKELLFRRDLFYSVEYATTASAQVGQIVSAEAEVTPPGVVV